MAKMSSDDDFAIPVQALTLMPKVSPISVLVEDGKLIVGVPDNADRASITIDGHFSKESFPGPGRKRVAFPAPRKPVLVEVVVSYRNSTRQDVFRETIEPR